MQDQEEHASEDELENTKQQLAQLQQELEAARQEQQALFAAEQQQLRDEHASEIHNLQHELHELHQQITEQQLQAEAAAEASSPASLYLQMQLAEAKDRAAKFEQDAAQAEQKTGDLQKSLQTAEALAATLKAQQMSHDQSRSRELTPPATPPASMPPPSNHQGSASHAASNQASATATANINIGPYMHPGGGMSQGFGAFPGWPSAPSRPRPSSQQQGHQGLLGQSQQPPAFAQPHDGRDLITAAQPQWHAEFGSFSPPQTLSLNEETCRSPDDPHASSMDSTVSLGTAAGQTAETHWAVRDPSASEITHPDNTVQPSESASGLSAASAQATGSNNSEATSSRVEDSTQSALPDLPRPETMSNSEQETSSLLDIQDQVGGQPSTAETSIHDLAEVFGPEQGEQSPQEPAVGEDSAGPDLVDEDRRDAEMGETAAAASSNRISSCAGEQQDISSCSQAPQPSDSSCRSCSSIENLIIAV